MALPKRRHSKSRRNKRRTHQVVAQPAVTQCAKCAASVLPHNACGKCGYYKGRKVDHTVKDEQKAAERR
jgi:large subunit ribosomal protein L32